MHTLLIDDHILFRQGLKFLLSDLDDNLIYYEADSLKQTLKINNLESISLVLLDYYLPGEEGLNTLSTLKKMIDAPIVILSSEDNPAIIRKTIDEGASGFIPKSSNQDILIAALRLILAGGTYLPPHVLQNYPVPQENVEVKSNQNTNKEFISSLSKRQLETLAMAIQGKTNKMIAREMKLAEGTIKAHLSASFRALGVNNRTEAVFAASKLNLVLP